MGASPTGRQGQHSAGYFLICVCTIPHDLAPLTENCWEYFEFIGTDVAEEQRGLLWEPYIATCSFGRSSFL